MLEGSSIDAQIAQQVFDIAKNYSKILVCLDSNHTENHVFEELILYSPLISVGSYSVVFETIVEYSPVDYIPGGRPWNPGNNPMTAEKKFYKRPIFLMLIIRLIINY